MKTLFLGIGNALRRDDGIGPFIVAELKKRLQTITPHTFVSSPGEGLTIMDLWQDYEHGIIFDACRANGEPGKRWHLDATKDLVPSDFFKYSSHAFGLAEAIELARTMETLPANVEIYAVEGKDFGFGEGLSDEVLAGCKDIINEIEKKYLS